MYKDHTAKLVSPGAVQKRIRLIDAISDSLKLAMQQHPNLVLMGQDIADYGGVFKITDGFTDQFGKDRVRNTPLCESAIIGIALGLSLKGYKAMVEMQFADFVTCGFNQIVNNAAKLHYRWGQNVDMVLRMPTGGGVGAGPEPVVARAGAGRPGSRRRGRTSRRGRSRSVAGRGGARGADRAAGKTPTWCVHTRSSTPRALRSFRCRWIRMPTVGRPPSLWMG